MVRMERIRMSFPRRQSQQRARLGILVCLLALYVAHATPSAAEPRQASARTNAHTAARKALLQGNADQAIALLSPLISSNPSDADALNLLCRVHLSEERDDDAVRECSAAVAASPSTAEYYRWLGRAYGAKAQHASMFTALGLARRVRENFQRAVQLDPLNATALIDLGEYYVEAPGALGGGKEKARTLVPALDKLDPARGHWLQARIAEDSGDPATAEAQYKLAVETASPTSVSNGYATSKAQAMADLASFLHKQHRNTEARALVRRIVTMDTLHDGALVAAAGTLRSMKAEPQLAIQMMQSYLESPHKSEEYPAFQVNVILGRVLLEQGDREGAAAQFAAALSLAHDYAPAIKAQKSLR